MSFFRLLSEVVHHETDEMKALRPEGNHVGQVSHSAVVLLSRMSGEELCLLLLAVLPLLSMVTTFFRVITGEATGAQPHVLIYDLLTPPRRDRRGRREQEIERSISRDDRAG